MRPAISTNSPTSNPAGTPSLRSQGRRFIAAVVLLVAGDALFWLMLAAVQSDSGLARLDGPVHSALVDSRTPWATALLTTVTTVTSPMWMTVIGFLAALGWAVWKREIWRPALLLGAMAVTVVLSAVIKNEIGRARPPASDFLLGPDDALSFPSGHTFGAGVFFLVLVSLLISRRNRRTTAAVGWIACAAAVAGTVLVAFSRLYLGYHWLTDVVASIGLAVAVTGIVILVDGLRMSQSAVPVKPQ
ncbi:phosphatase PAP2 family protein [Micrococcaceae bacterium Sec5.7]